MTKRDSQLRALRADAPDFVASRRQQEAERATADAAWLRQRGIKTRQELTPELSMRSVHEPMSVLGLAMEGGPQNVESLKKIGANIAEDVVRMPQQMFGPSGSEAERLHQLYGTQPERFSPELNPIEASQADLAQLLYEMAEPGPGGEARLFFGSKEMREQALHVLDWARKNLRGEARRGLLNALRQGVILDPQRPGAGALGTYSPPRFLGAGGPGEEMPAKLSERLGAMETAARKRGVGEEFAEQDKRFYKFWEYRKKQIVDEYKDTVKQAAEQGHKLDLPTTATGTPVPPIHMVEAMPGGPHELSTMFHELGIHASDFNMKPSEFNRAMKAITGTSFAESLESHFDPEYIGKGHEQLAQMLQRLGSGEERLPSMVEGMDPMLAQRQIQGWNLPGVAGEFPKTPAGSQLEQRTLEPTLQRWGQWKERSKGTGQFAGEPGFLEELAQEETLAKRMKRRR